MHRTHLVGARTHNLKSVSLDLVPGELVCLAGLSGSGKSSLAVDTLYAEGQRRFVESFSPYARQFLERLERPPMDELEPVAAAVAVDRKAPIKSSRSTVATMADVEAYLSALFTREAVPVCTDCHTEAVRTSPTRAAEEIGKAADGVTIIAYPLRISGTDDFLDAREKLSEAGYRRLLVSGEVKDLDQTRPSEAVGQDGRAWVVVDRIQTPSRNQRRLQEAISEAWKRGNGSAVVSSGGTDRLLSQGLTCPRCGRTFERAHPGLFSYQSPVGACPSCHGFGRTIGIDWRKVIPNEHLSLSDGAIRPWTGRSSEWERKVLRRFAERTGISMEMPWEDLSAKQKKLVIEGEGTWHHGKYPGVRAWFEWLETRTYKMHVRVLLARYRSYDICSACQGRRLNQAALGYHVGGMDLSAWHALELGRASQLLASLTPQTAQGELLRRELSARLGYLERVGLGYLTLDRQARSLSGGEAQRVSLTAALGSSLTGALFVIDEPTVGLHPADVRPLALAMQRLAKQGNAVVVIEHDPLVIWACDRVVELGPGAGPQGGRILFDMTPEAISREESVTGKLLARTKPTTLTPLPAGRPPTGLARARHAQTPNWHAGGSARQRRKPRGWLSVRGARANNLRNITLEIPLGVLCAITGPSGSGKSTLAEEIVYRALAKARGQKDVDPAGDHDAVAGGEQLRQVSLVDQSPLGRTSRGNPATYTKAWDRLRARFASEPAAELRNLSASHFSFNVSGGRCEACSGEGYETVEMQFLADVALICPTCQGKRFREEVLAVRHRGWTVAEALERTVDEVLDHFRDDPAIVRALGPVSSLGLGYLPLGQPLSTLSGGEAQRLKLARALSEDHQESLLILDEPSAGLHAADVARVESALELLVDAGASILLVEHDTDLIRAADYLIDLGPAGGLNGGQVVAVGTPEEVESASTLTSEALRGIAPLPRSESASSEAASAPAIVVERAREHNLQEVSCQIPHGQFVVVTGPSGSGKSTLAFDVVFAEGQRRFLETLTPYARQFLPTMPRPDVDRVAGVPPSIALEQRTVRAGVNSTVATVTEVAHYLRLLFAKLGNPHCPHCDCPIEAMPSDAILEKVQSLGDGWTILAPAVEARKGTHLDLFAAAAKQGIGRAWVDGQLVSTDKPPKLAKTREHDIDLVIYEGKAHRIDRVILQRALDWGRGAVKATESGKGKSVHRWSTDRTCPQCGTAVPEFDPRWFSFNTKQGRCPDCEGSGVVGGVEAALEGEAPTCPSCGGSRLGPLPRAVRLEGKRYHEVTALPVARACQWVRDLAFQGDRARVASAPHAELIRRLEFLDRVGLSYLSLDRAARTLSGGEMQRLRLSAQLGAGLTGALYVLDEPTIGLHPRDTSRLLANLRALVDTGSTVLVVEHDADTIRAADYLLDLGPSGGRHGGTIVASGPPEKVLSDALSPTAAALSMPRVHQRKPAEPASKTPSSKTIDLEGARAHNLKGVALRVPVGRMTVVAGVSGSGKSTLVRQVFYPALRQALGLVGPEPGPFASLSGAKVVSRAVAVDQSPIGRTPRSVPATFLGIWDEIRRLFAGMPEAKTSGLSASQFSFNGAKGGRCQECQGQGVICHEMSFLPDVVTPCQSCGGTRFDPRTLEVRYLGMTIGDVLRLTAEEAANAFRVHPTIARPLTTLSDLGVGYVQLGQGSNTLSGGEAQRLKLAAELTAGTRHEPTVYVLDEPTTGLHQADVMRLIGVLYRLVDRGDTLLIIEHHPSVIASAEHVIELGPEGGEAGGRVIAEGSPQALSRMGTATGRVLRDLFAEGVKGSKSPRFRK